MKDKRQVELGVLYKLLKVKRPFALIGIIFTFVSLFIIVPSIVILISALKKPYERYDFDGIKKNGIEKDAKIIFINSVNNVDINGQHPQIIGYEYNDNNQTIADKFETLDVEIIKSFQVGQSVKILSFNHESIIKGLEPFSFPFYLFYILPAIFLLIGISFLLIGLIPALKTFSLYKQEWSKRLLLFP